MIAPEDFLRLAESLLDFGDEEVIYRTAISRCYYYAFHFVRENYGTHPYANFRYDYTDHEEIIEFFRRVRRRDLASQILSFRNKRNIADYELSRSVKYDQAKEFIDDVKYFISELKSSNLLL
jgi:uncharacterized protein (UPF0332 family)